MIPILYESTEVGFTSNGLGRLRDAISVVVTEERNGLYEMDMEYPVDGIHFDLIQCGRIIAVTHDESHNIQPFDIVSYERPINGVVKFHCTHVSYRQCAMTVSGTNINSLADAFTMLGNAQPGNPFMYWTNKTNLGFLASADGVPHTVRQILGGMEGSILDAYGGEYEWDRWTVKLWASRGSLKPFTIRYGVNLTDYSEEVDYSDTYTACIPYWTGQDNNGNDVIVTGSMQTAEYPSFNGITRCIPLDVTDKFENKPTAAQVEAQGLSYINANQTYLPAQNIKVDFVRISDSPEYAQFASLQQCRLCDTINVEFPRYNMTGQFKIVKTEYDVLREKYNTLELGTLSTSLAEALGINQESSNRLSTTNIDDYVVDYGTSGSWHFRKWKSGISECWGLIDSSSRAMTTAEGSGYYAAQSTYAYPTGLFNGSPNTTIGAHLAGSLGSFSISYNSSTELKGYWWATKSVTKTVYLYAHAIGTWA